MGKLTFIDEHKAEVVSCGVLLVDLAEGGGEIEPTQEQADGDRLSSGGGAIHYL